MSEKGFSVRLSANVDQYVAAMAKARAATATLSAESIKNFEKAGGDLQKLGGHVTRMVTLPVVAAGAGMVASAVSWESAFAGVAKTVDGTAVQIERLEGDLRSMARSLPASHREIAAVAEAAGQLGVHTEDITRFTRVMVDLGETTNLTADEAATSIAQLMNVMGTAPQDVDRLASMIAHLGNNGASTERDVVQMSQRIAGAASVVGLTTAEVGGFANAIASVGIESEAGGSSFSRVITDMGKAAQTGGKELDLFAEVAGMSAQQFATAFTDDPAAAIVAFVNGLGRISAAGGNVFGVLDQLGLSDVRVSRTMLTLAESGDLLTRSLDDANQGWSENTALATEAGKRYATSAAQLAILRNQIVDVAIDLGVQLLPALLGVAGGVAGLVRWFGDLPGPLQATALGFIGVMAAMGPLMSIGGTVLKNFAAIKAAMVGISTFLAANPWAIALVGAAAVIGTAALALRGHESASEQAAERADAFYRTVQSGLGSLDLQKIALADAASAARDYRESLMSGADEDLIGVVTGTIDREDLKHQSEYVEVMRRLGLTLDEVTRVNLSGADANKVLTDSRRKLLDLDELTLGMNTAKVAGLMSEAEQTRLLAAARAEYIATGQLTGDNAEFVTMAGNTAAAEFVELLRRQTIAAYDSAEAAAELVRVGDLQAFAYLKGTGQLHLLTEAEIRVAEARASHAAMLDREVGSMKDADEAGAQLAATTAGLGGALALSEEQIAANADAAKRLQDATANARNEFDLLAAAADVLESALAQVFGGPGGEERAWNAYAAGVDSVNETLTENGVTLDRHTAKGRANREQLVDQLDTISELGVAMVRNGASTDEAAGAVNMMTEALVGQMVQAGMSEEAARAFIDELGRTPEDVTTAMSVAVDQATRAELEDLLEQMGTIDAGAEAEITALLNRGSFDEALRLVEALSRGLPLELWLNAGQNASGGGAYRSAQGRYVPGGANLVSTFGEEGPEAILPLDKPGRLRELLADPRISGPIIAQLGMAGSNQMMTGGASAWARTERAALLDPFTVTTTSTPATDTATAGNGDRTMANRFERGDISAADYDAYLANRQASLEKFSDEEQAIHRIRQGLIDDEKRAKDDELAAERDRMAARFQLGEISAADYQNYLQGLLGSFTQYGADYMTVWGTIQQLQRDAADEQQKIIDDTAKANKQSTDEQFAAAKAQLELVDATTAANDASAAYTAAGTKNYLYALDKNRTPEERAAATEELAAAARKVADTAYRKRDAEANAAGLEDGTSAWAQSMRAALGADSAWSAANGRPDIAAAIDALLVGIPVMGTGGRIRGTADGTIVRAGENNVDEFLLRDDQLAGIHARQLNAFVNLAAQQPYRTAGTRGTTAGQPTVQLGDMLAKLFIDGRQLTGVIRTEIELDSNETAARLMAGTR